MTYPVRAVIANALFLVLIAITLLPVLVPLWLYDAPPANLPFAIPITVMAFPGSFLALLGLADSLAPPRSPSHPKPGIVRALSGLAFALHVVGWGSWVLVVIQQVDNPITITGVIAPMLGMPASIAAIIIGVIAIRRQSGSSGFRVH